MNKMTDKKVSVDKYVKQVYPVRCLGRNKFGEDILASSVDVLVNITKAPGSSMISSDVECKYNVGAHGERCNADKVFGGKVTCPYSFDIPYALEKKTSRR